MLISFFAKETEQGSSWVGKNMEANTILMILGILLAVAIIGLVVLYHQKNQVKTSLEVAKVNWENERKLREEEKAESEQEMQEAFMTYQNILIGQIVQRNHEKADTFFQENRGKEGVVTTDSGLQYQILVESDGAHPKATDKVKFHYILRDLEGNVLQNSHDAGEEAPTMAINGLVEGLVEGMPLMTVGSTWRFWLPSDLAYGDAGAGNDIEPGAAIQFDIQLVDIEPAEETRQN